MIIGQRVVAQPGGSALFWEREVRMDMLHLVPVALLSSVGLWLMWPVFVDPIMRWKRTVKLREHGATDTLADAIFQDWNDQNKVIDPRP